MTEGRLLRSFSIVGGVAALGLCVGLSREILYGRSFGTGIELDAFLVAILAPTLVADILSQAVAAALLPVLLETREKEGREASFVLVSSVLTIVTLLALIACTALFFLAPLMVGLVAPGLNAGERALASSLLRWVLPAGLLWSTSGILRAVHQADGRTTIAALQSPVTGGVLVLFLIFFTSNVGILAAAWGTVAGHLAFVLVLLLAMRKEVHGLRPCLRWTPAARKVLLLAGPLVAGMAVANVRLLVDRFFGSALAAGTISALHYARRIEGMAHIVLGLSVSTVLYPFLARRHSVRDDKGFSTAVERSLIGLTTLLAPLVVVFLCLGEPLVRLLLLRGRFGEESVQRTAQILLFLSLGTIPFALNHVLNHAFYARHRVLLPVAVGMGGKVLNVLVCIALVPRLGAVAIALAASLDMGATFLVRLGILYRDDPRLSLARLSSPFLRTLIAALVAGGAGLVTSGMLDSNSARLVLGSLVIGITYVVAGLLLGIPGLAALLRRVPGLFFSGRVAAQGGDPMVREVPPSHG